MKAAEILTHLCSYTSYLVLSHDKVSYFTKQHFISGRLQLWVVCSWVSNRILVALES